MASGVLATLRRNGGLWFQGLFVLAGVISAGATIIALGRSSPTDDIPEGLLTLLATNLVILFALAWMIVSRYRAIRRNPDLASGGRLTRRFMILGRLEVIALLPALNPSFWQR